jgi:hypothetical protein
MILTNFILYFLWKLSCKFDFFSSVEWLLRRFLIDPTIFLSNIISYGRKSGALFERIWIPYTQGWFVPSLIEIGLLVLERKITGLLLLFLHYIPCRRAFPLIWTNLNPFWPRMIYVKSGWHWSGGSVEVENMKSKQMDRQTTDNRR